MLILAKGSNSLPGISSFGLMNSEVLADKMLRTNGYREKKVSN